MNIALNNIKALTIVTLLGFLTACQTTPTQKSTAKDTNVEVEQPLKQQKVEPPKVDSVAVISPAVQTLLAQAETQLAEENINAAIDSLERAIRIAPRYPESYYRLGLVYFMQGNFKQARSLAQKSISLGANGKIREQAIKMIAKTAP
jgi:tetratricopeptide (TPR) repeat protein